MTSFWNQHVPGAKGVLVLHPTHILELGPANLTESDRVPTSGSPALLLRGRQPAAPSCLPTSQRFFSSGFY